MFRGRYGRQATKDDALRLRKKTLDLVVCRDTNGKLWVVEKFGEDFVDGMLVSHPAIACLPTMDAKLAAWKTKMELPPSANPMGSYTWADELFMYVASYR